jgi:hypothetical protein
MPTEQTGSAMKRKRPIRSDAQWSKRKEIPDAQIRDAADQYEQACRLLAGQPSGVLLPLMNVASMALELYLKALSAELIHVEDDLIPEVSRVYAAPAITGTQGHGLPGLLLAMPDDVRAALVEAFDAVLKPAWHIDLQTTLSALDGVLMASRYPFEHGTDITKYDLKQLVELTGFLARFVRTIPETDRITWKTA